MKLALMMKGMSGNLGPEEMLALFESMGVKIETREVPLALNSVRECLEGATVTGQCILEGQ